MATLAELKAKAEELLEKADSAETIADAKKFNQELEQTINEATSVSKQVAFDKCQASENPIHTAITEFYFPSIRVRTIKEKDTGVEFRSIVECDKPIDLGELHEKLSGIGADKNWIYITQKVNELLTLRVAKDLGASVKIENYRMEETAKQIDLGKSPTSNTNILKTLQTIVTAMLGEGYNATSHDVAYLKGVFFNDNKGKKSSVRVADHRTFRNYLKKVCYRILTNGNYEVESREIKG